MKIATFNVNSVNARVDGLLPWLDRLRPDILLLQEIKTEFNSFPFLNFKPQVMRRRFSDKRAIMAWPFSADTKLR